MRNEKLYNLIVLFVIVTAGLGAAWLCFGVLKSDASGKLQQYSFSGAIAGALISWSVLAAIYGKLRSSSDELSDLRRENEDLKHKLIRGAPRPQGFDIEVDERQSIVLARPKDWEPKGGIIFQLELADENMKPGDIFAAGFTCSFIPIQKNSKQTRDQFYASLITWFDSLVQGGYVQSYSQEVMRVGGDAAGVESLKIIARQIARVEIRKDPATLRMQRSWMPVTWMDFVGWIRQTDPTFVYTGSPAVIEVQGNGFHKGAICYVNKKPRVTTVTSAYTAKVTLENEDVAWQGSLEIHIENPETKGKPSNSVWLGVMNKITPWMTTPEAAAGDAKKASFIGTPLPEIFDAEPQQKAGAESPVTETIKGDATKAETPAAAPAPNPASSPSPKPEEPTVTFVEIVSMNVYCYQESLERAFYFGFWDDVNDFLESSDEFNRILASARFLS